MRTITYFSVVVKNKTGAGAKALAALKAAGLNLTAFWGYPIKGKKAVLELAPDDPKGFAKAIKKLGYEAGPKKTAFHVEGEDRIGVMADVLERLASAGIDVHAAQAICAGAGRFGALIQVDEKDEKKAKKALGAA